MQTVKNTVVGSGIFSVTADDSIQMKATNGTIAIEAAKDTDGIVSIKAAEDMRIEAGDEMSIGAGGEIRETGSSIYMNTSSKPATNAATASPVAADSAAIAAVGKPAYVAETMSLLVTDIPNPVAANPPLISDDSHGLALNANTTTGTGGENIRDLEDLLSDMSSGVVAHTWKPSSNVGAQVWSGPKTTEPAGDWSGYNEGPLSDTFVLGPKSLSTIRRFHGWVEDGDVASSKGVTWNCTIDSTRP